MKTITTKILAACIFTLASFSFRAQVATLYSFSQFQGTYTPVTGGTVFSTSLYDDQDIVDPFATPVNPPSVGSGLAIGFNFLFDNIVFDRIGVSNNGYIMLGNSSNGTSAINEQILDWNRPISSTSASTPNQQHRISPFGNDMLSKTTSSITVQTLGVAPVRTCVIQWSNYQRFYASPTGNDNINFQLRLSETSNIIDAVYGTIIQVTEDTLIEVGLRGGSNADFNNRDVTNPNVWATSIPGTLNTSACRYNSTKVPASGLTYRWQTPQCSGSLATLNTTATVPAACPNASFNVSLQNSYTVAGISYTWSNSTSSSTGPYTVMPNPGGASQNSLTINAPNWYQVAATCIHSNATATSTPYFVDVAQAPTITAAANPTTLCSGNSLTLTAAGNATAYVWAGGYTSGVGFPATTSATYVVTGTSSLGCTATASVPVAVVQTPTQPIAVNPFFICVGSSATLTAPGAANYTWTSGAQTVFTSSFVITPTSAGTTTYSVIKANSVCVDTKTTSVVTNSLPTIFAIVNPTIVCALQSASLAVGGGISYTWTAPGNATFSGPSPVVSPSVSTSYSVAASDGTCISITTVSLAVNPNPTITAVAATPSICNGQSVTLTANGGINYTWTTTTGTLTGQSIVDMPTTATAYNVTGDNIFGCTSGAVAIVIVNPTPVIFTSASKALVCSGNPSTLTATGANTYTWDASANGANTATTIVNPTNPTSTTMIYTVTGSNSYPCQSSQTVQVGVFVPTLTISGNTNTCEGGVVTLGASGGNANTYSWLTSIGATPYAFQTLNATVTAPAVYTVNAMTSTLSVVCPATQTVSVGVYYNPTITATPQRSVICTKESVDLYGGGGVSYSWSNGTPGGTITVSPNTNTTYTVNGIDANGCPGTGTVLVKVSGCSGINELSNVNNGLVLYPNPNNGEFTIEANTEIGLTLINELGQTIRTITLSGTNNYKVSINDLPKGIYFISGQKDNTRIYQKIVVNN